MKTKPTIVVTGASGFIGSAVVDYFSKQNYPVIALVRVPNKGKVNENVRFVSYQMEDSNVPDVFTENCILIHCAFVKTMQSDKEDVNLLAAKRLIEKADEKLVGKRIFLSSLSASSLSGTNYAKQKQAIESIFSSANSVIFRPGLVIGKGGMFASSMKFINRFGCIPILGEGNQAIFYIGVVDLCCLIEEVIHTDRNGVFYALHTEPVSYSSFYKTLAEAKNIKVRKLRIPVGLAKLGARLLSLFRSTGITVEAINGLNAVPNLDVEISEKSTFNYQLTPLETLFKEL